MYLPAHSNPAAGAHSPQATPEDQPMSADTQKSAAPGDTVKVHYTGRLVDGTEFDSSRGAEPLELTLGQGQTIPGFEDAIIGMAAGEQKSVTIPCDSAYGARNEEMTRPCRARSSQRISSSPRAWY
jgi:FKBP-type peptidyl-prolyl cis-trans isomerase